MTTSIWGTGANTVVPNNANNWGYNTLFSPATSKGNFPPMISPTIPQCQIQNGNLLPSKIPISTKNFKIPLLSSIVGVLIDPASFLMIPLKSLEQLLL